MEQQLSKKSLIAPMDGERYTKYLSSTYDFLTTLTGWRRKIARYALEGLDKNGKLLDVGCGTGYLLSLAQQNGFKEITGVDPSSGMLKKAQEENKINASILVQAGADQLPFDDNSFDIVVASGSLVYVPDMAAAAKEISRVLKVGGRLRVIDHATPVDKKWNSFFIHVFSQISGDIIHDFEHYFKPWCQLEARKTLGRGGYMQRFDFVKV